jgi:hypothetical protein
MALLRYMIIDEDGQRIGRFESSQTVWKCGDAFDLEGRSWRIVEILPEVSTMVGYNAVWVAAPAVGGEDDEVTAANTQTGSYPGAAR